MSEFLNNTDKVPAGAHVDCVLLSGTDATQVIPGHLTVRELSGRASAVKSHIHALGLEGKLHPNYVKQLEQFIDTKLQTDLNSRGKLADTQFAGQHNPSLASMRILSGVQSFADTLSTSTNPAVLEGNIVFNLVGQE